MLDNINKYESDICLCNCIECSLILEPIKYDYANRSLKTNFNPSVELEIV